MMHAFTVLTGMVTLIGFLLQLRDAFPKWRPYYVPATYVLAGLTGGLIIGILSGVTVNVSLSITPRNLVGFALFGGSGLVVLVCSVACTVISDEKRRRDASGIGTGALSFLVLMLFLFTTTLFPDVRNYLTYDELIDCAVTASRRQSYERVLHGI